MIIIIIIGIIKRHSWAQFQFRTRRCVCLIWMATNLLLHGWCRDSIHFHTHIVYRVSIFFRFILFSTIR